MSALGINKNQGLPLLRLSYMYTKKDNNGLGVRMGRNIAFSVSVFSAKPSPITYLG